MKEKHEVGKDGLLEDGVSYYPADVHDMQTFGDAKRDLAQFLAPVLVHAGHLHERLYIAAFDGTGNDALNDPEHATNVAKIRQQVTLLNKAGNKQIKLDYVEGPGTQDNPIDRTWDGMRGYTYDARIEQMYKMFIDQAWRWKREDSSVQIGIVDIGFSRGAEQAAGFARLVHERGIQDPSGANYTYDARGKITDVTYSKPPIVAPGQVAQAVGLFDPVGTGVPLNDKDRRLPPSVISGFQLIAEDEHRGLFKSSHIIDPGMTPDGRFLGVTVAGAHSDVGGSYHRDGLGIRSGNLMIDYLNALSDQPYLEKTAEPDDPRRNMVHRSEEGSLLYRVWENVDRGEPGGYEERLLPKDQMDKVPDAYNAEPRDEALSQQFERHNVSIGSVVKEGFPAAQHGGARPSQIRVQEQLSAFQDILRRDDRGEDVRALQQQLRSLGYTDAHNRALVADGHFGPATRAAVQAFQQGHGLAVDGVVDLQTREALHRQAQQLQHDPIPVTGHRPHSSIRTPLQVGSDQPDTRQQHTAAEERLAHPPSIDSSFGQTVTIATTIKPSAVTYPSIASASSPELDATATTVLQQQLQTLGMTDHRGQPLPVTGIYDDTTRVRVMMFQKEQGLPGTGVPDPATRALIEARATIAELQQIERAHPASQQDVPLRQVMRGPAATAESAAYPDRGAPLHPAGQPETQGPALDDPRNARNPHHALYNELHRRIPEASEKRLLQFTAACHSHDINVDNLAKIYFDRQNGTMTFSTSWPPIPSAVVDLKVPSPEPQQSIQHIHQYDQWHAQMMSEVRAHKERVEAQAQQGPVMGAPAL
jgi:peptidoglycan hydrolase-like protein with peptidoglycan-binding domain